MKVPTPLLALVALGVVASPAPAETYSLATSWPVDSDVSQIAGDGSTLYLLSPSGVFHYSASGGLLDSWSPLTPSSLAGFDETGNPLLAEYHPQGSGRIFTTIRTYTPDGVPGSSSEFIDLIRAVDRQGYAYAPGVDFGIAKYAPDGSPVGDYGAEIGLTGIAWDETLFGIQLNDPDITIRWFTTALSMLGSVQKRICREDFDTDCYMPWSATTDGSGGAFVAAAWREPASNPDGFEAGQSVDHFGGSGQRLSRFSSFGKLVTDSQGAVYVYDSGTVEKWVPETTPSQTTSWGAVKARYSR